MNSLKNFNANNDLFNPQKFSQMNDFRPSDIQRAELNQKYGVIKDLFGFYLLFDSIEFVLRDEYGNELYIALASKKEQVFKLMDSFEFQICSTLKEFDVLIRNTFRRKPSRLV